MSRKLFPVAVVAIIAAGCGSPVSSTSSPVCDGWVGAATAAATKAVACNVTSFTFPLSTSQACNAAVAQCSSADQQLLGTATTCLNGVPVCTAQTQVTFTTSIQSCLAPLSGLSAACQSASAGSGNGLGSCTIGVYCVDYGGLATIADIQQGCQVAGGTYASSACPTANRVGTCAANVAGTNLTEYLRVYLPLTAAQGQSSCLGGQFGAVGNWSAG